MSSDSACPTSQQAQQGTLQVCHMGGGGVEQLVLQCEVALWLQCAALTRLL
jgi:hypothetical protein